MSEIQYISDADGKPVGVIVPIELWEEIKSEKEFLSKLPERSLEFDKAVHLKILGGLNKIGKWHCEPSAL